jgi:hypothetical protein
MSKGRRPGLPADAGASEEVESRRPEDGLLGRNPLMPSSAANGSNAPPPGGFDDEGNGEEGVDAALGVKRVDHDSPFPPFPIPPSMLCAFLLLAKVRSSSDGCGASDAALSTPLLGSLLKTPQSQSSSVLSA